MNYSEIYGCGALRQIVLCDMTPKQMNDDEWKLGLYQGKNTKADMERDAGKDFRGSVEKITVPVHYFYAVPGSLFCPELAQWYKEHVLTPYRSVAFEDSTHMLITDHPEKFADEVIKVLEM